MQGTKCLNVPLLFASIASSVDTSSTNLVLPRREEEREEAACFFDGLDLLAFFESAWLLEDDAETVRLLRPRA